MIEIITATTTDAVGNTTVTTYNSPFILFLYVVAVVLVIFYAINLFLKFKE